MTCLRRGLYANYIPYLSPAMLATFSTRPPVAWFSIMGSMRWHMLYTDFRFTSVWASQVSSLSSAGPPGSDFPTLLMRISTRPCLAMQAFTNFLQAEDLVTSLTEKSAMLRLE